MPSFLVFAGQRPAPSFGISMPWSAESPLRNSRPAAGNLPATRRAAQKGRWPVFLLTVPTVKISVLTSPSKKKDTLIVCLSFWKGANKGKRDPAPIGAGSQRCWKTLNIPSFCQPQVAVTLGFLHLLARRAISRTVMTRPTMSVIVSGMNINSPATMK